MIIWRIQPPAKDHARNPASCNWSFEGSSFLQMIIWRIRPLANDHLEDLASCKWSSGGTGLLQMIIRHPRHPNHLSQDLDSISRTFLEQFALVTSAILYQTHALSYIAVLKDYFKLYHLSGHSTCSSSSATTGSTCFKKSFTRIPFLIVPA